ncbi:MAG: hypothetical protein U0936_24340 [Planctomycetaceae bacterium]
MTTLSPAHEVQASRTAAPKWAAIVQDTLVPLPRRRLKVRDILAQAGIAEGLLVRDFNQPRDIAFAPEDQVDLAEGNVFVVRDDCASGGSVDLEAQPKLAFIADDAWEVTTQPTQTLASLRGLFDLPDDAVVLRDFESPNDVEIDPTSKVYFEDGPVLRVRITSVTVKVNNLPVKFTKRVVTGLEVKQTAIAQGVSIDVGCVLYRLKPGGGLGPALSDQDRIALRRCDEFRCVAPDDNS